MHNVEQAAHALGLQIRVLHAGTDDEIDAAFATITQEHISALALIGDPFYDTRRSKLVALSAQHKVPTMFYFGNLRKLATWQVMAWTRDRAIDKRENTRRGYSKVPSLLICR